MNLSYNEIVCIEKLNIPSLVTLNLEHNSISTFKDSGFKLLDRIISIKLGYNFLSSLKIFKHVYNVQVIEMQMNNIHDLLELTHLQHLLYLMELDLTGNFVTHLVNYFEVCLSLAYHLVILDGEYVTASQKLQSYNRFYATPFLKSAKRNALMLLTNEMNHPLITASIIPFDQPSPPIVVLVGAVGSKKKYFVKKIQEALSQ